MSYRLHVWCVDCAFDPYGCFGGGSGWLSDLGFMEDGEEYAVHFESLSEALSALSEQDIDHPAPWVFEIEGSETPEDWKSWQTIKLEGKDE